jgi:putative phage-type endonuclease
MEETLVFLFYEYYRNHVSELHHPWFEADMVENVKELAVAQLEEAVDEDVVAQALDLFKIMYPCRTSLHVPPQPDFETALQRMRDQPNHEQRTAAWYETRHQLVTASSAYKIFGSPCEVNALIVEKCAPEKERPPLSVYDARHWGVRYEPVSVMYYAHTRGTMVEEFGCIVHPTIPFLGASPDGVNVLPNVEVYGRMLEIKNPVSRVITGEPTLEYWIQMQLQMEVCGLNACDFLETRFVEYPTHEAFMADGTFTTSADGKPKGVILFFYKEGKYDYEYAPYGATEEVVAEWETMQTAVEGRELAQTLYWKLEQVSCVVVQRNTAWFEAHRPQMALFWETVVKERENGKWTERMPVKKVSTF